MSNKSISDSAFLVNESRSRRVDISKDIYASLWINESSNKLWNDFYSEVYHFDDIQLSLRNRFFLEQFKSFIEKSSNPVFVNIGAGFTSYPFLVSRDCKFIEVDMSNVIEYKQKKIKHFIENGDFPNRDITFISADICNKNDQIKLEKSLIPLLDNNLSFVLIEGVTYFLKMQDLTQLFDMLSEIQTSDSILAFDYWKKDDVDHLILRKLMRFFTDHFGFAENQYNLIDSDFIQNINGYKPVESTDIQELEKTYTEDNFLSDYNKILPEYYVLLRKLK
ncbi:class I SAM-dependent methyltransferase [Thermoplasmatota archaeon]